MAEHAELSDWMDQWMDRNHNGLRMETLGVACVLTILTLYAGFRTVVSLRRTRRQLDLDPSERTAILSQSNDSLRGTNKFILVLSYIWLMHGMSVWVFDAVISMSMLAEEDSGLQALRDFGLGEWALLGSMLSTILALFFLVIVVIPRLQMMGIASFLARSLGASAEEFRLHIIPQACTVSTQLAQTWSIIFFCSTSLWSTNAQDFVRPFLLQAIAFSALAWLNASYLLNLFPEQVMEKIENQELDAKAIRAELYALFLSTSRRNKAVSAGYEALPQGQTHVDEKMPLQLSEKTAEV